MAKDSADNMCVVRKSHSVHTGYGKWPFKPDSRDRAVDAMRSVPFLFPHVKRCNLPGASALEMCGQAAFAWAEKFGAP